MSRGFQEFLRKEEEERLAPIKEAERQFKENSKAIALKERDRIKAAIESGARDENFRPDPAYDDAVMATADVGSFNFQEALRFVENNPDYYACPENSEKLEAYLESQGVTIISELSFKTAYERLSSFNLLLKKPEATPEPVATPQPPPAPTGEWGIDLSTGEPRFYSNFVIGQMDAATYKKTFKVRNMQLGRLTRLSL